MLPVSTDNNGRKVVVWLTVLEGGQMREYREQNDPKLYANVLGF